MNKTNLETQNDKLSSIVRKYEDDYISGVTTNSKYVERSMYEDIQKIEAYVNSKHTTGDKDALEREKPFFNIVTAAENIWFRATDIDRKNIRIKASSSEDVLLSYLATAKLNEWMNKENFGMFLNKWGRTLARYGSAVVKFVPKDGKLHCNVVPWNRLIVDTVDFNNNIVIEILELTEAQLRRREGYDKEMVDALCEAKTSRTNLDRQKKDNKDDYIKLYEIHGELPLSYLTNKESDEDTYVQQMHVLSFVAGKNKGEFDDYTLISGREKKNPYMITHLIEEDGQTLAIGAVQHLFEAQWMMNHSIKAMKDQLDLASKLIFQTSDGNFVGQNALTAIETGDIMIHSPNEPLTQLQNNSHDITAIQNFASQWKMLAQEITSTPDAIAGNTMPSGTAYRQVAILNQESHSLFEIMTENKGLYIEEMLREYVIPYIKTQLDTTEEVVVTLGNYGIDKINSIFLKEEGARISNRYVKEKLLEGEIPEQPDMNAIQQNIQDTLDVQGNERFITPGDVPSDTWKKLFKDFEWKVIVEVTPENTDKEATLTTFNTVLQTIASNPMILQDPNAKLLFNKILEETGRISPVEIQKVSQQTPPPQQAPGAPVVA